MNMFKLIKFTGDVLYIQRAGEKEDCSDLQLTETL